MATSNNNLRPASIMSKDLAKSARKGGKANSYNITVGGGASSSVSEKLIICRCVFLSNIDLNGAETSDGITVANGEIVLVNGQTDKKENGVYLVATGGAWVRSGTLYSGMLISIKEGTNYKDTLWILETPNNDPVIGTDNIEFLQIDAKKISLPLSVANGGTGATTASSARSNLGLGTAATKNTGTSAGNVLEFSVTGVLPAVSGANLTNLNASNISSGTINPARLNLSTNKRMLWNNSGALAETNFSVEGSGGRSLWIAEDDLSSFFRIGSNSNVNIWFRNDGSQFIRTSGGGNALFINDNSDATTNIGTGTGINNIGNSSANTNIYGSTLILAGTNNRINVGSDATGDILYRNSSGNLARLAIGSNGDVLTVSSGLPSWSSAGGGSGTVTSVAISGGTTGITVSGSPITTSGTITLGGTVAIAHGGTGAATDAGARTNLGLDIGIDVQAYSDLVQEIADLTGDGVLVKSSTNIATNSAIKTEITKYKTARESITSSATIQDDDDFQFAVEANKTYAINGFMAISAGATSGFKWIFSVPSGASGRINFSTGASNASANVADTDITVGAGATAAINITSTGQKVYCFGYVTISSTSGNVIFRWAQNASNGTATYIERGSVMTLTEI
jgi:hypothetical protein